MPSPRVVEINGYALREIREGRRRHASDLAKALDVNRSYITKLENGSRQRVSRVLYQGLLDELGIVEYRTLLANPHGAVAEIPADAPAVG